MRDRTNARRAPGPSRSARVAVAAWLAASLLMTGANGAETRPEGERPGDRILSSYFRNETASLSQRCLAEIRTLADWTARRDEYRRALFDMLGLWPLPEK